MITLTLSPVQANALGLLFTGMAQGMAGPRECVTALEPVQAQLVVIVAAVNAPVLPPVAEVFARSEAPTPVPKVIPPHVEHKPEHKGRHR